MGTNPKFSGVSQTPQPLHPVHAHNSPGALQIGSTEGEVQAGEGAVRAQVRRLEQSTANTRNVRPKPGPKRTPKRTTEAGLAVADRAAKRFLAKRAETAHAPLGTTSQPQPESQVGIHLVSCSSVS